MSNLGLIENREKALRKEGFSFDWKDSLSIQRLLDTISSILTEEYIVVAKHNPEVFKKIASGASRPRNDTFSDYNDGGKK